MVSEMHKEKSESGAISVIQNSAVANERGPFESFNTQSLLQRLCQRDSEAVERERVHLPREVDIRLQLNLG